MRFILHPTFGKETSNVHNIPSIPGTSSSNSFCYTHVILLFHKFKVSLVSFGVPRNFNHVSWPHLFGTCTHDLYLTFLL